MKYFIYVLSLLLMFGCTKQSVNFSETKFPIGQKLYISKCGGCHRLYDKLEYSPAKWDTILTVMRSKAKIKSDEEKEILLFLKERY